ncbi:MAG: carbamoyltransferase [Elusimicrobiota bacterium]
MYILGVSCYFHDAAAAIICDGQLIAAAEEERFSRKKHDYNFPKSAIQFCLETANITPDKLDYVVFYEKPFVKFQRILLTILKEFPHSQRVFTDAIRTWLLDKLWIKGLLLEKFNIAEDRVLFLDHHLSHASGAFLISPFKESAILTVDGVGEWATTSVGHGSNTKITLLEEMVFPFSVGLLYSTFTAFLGFEVNEGEYKVMGMAPYGKPNYVDKIYKIVDIADDGSFSLDMDYFAYHRSSTTSYSKKFVKLFGPPRPPKLHFFTKSSGYPSYFGEKPENYDELCEKNQYYADLASSIQDITEEILVKMANYLYKKTHLDKLCIGGGVALNCVANARILRETPFKQIFIQPATGDSGGAVGAALYLWNSILGNKRDFVMNHACWGKRYSNQYIKNFLDSLKIKYKFIQNENELIEKVTNAIIDGKVIGWFHDRFEWGPRALGNRSILADPRREDMKDIINTKIKFREPYRPFAPSVLVEYSEDFFELPQTIENYPARFMLLTTNVKKDKIPKIPAITHIDGTARIQTVFRDTNPRYYKLIENFYKKTEIPLLLNTSFNLKGEPIVNTPENAYSTFTRSELDMLVLENFIVKK